MKRYLTLLLVLVSLCFAASALAAPRAGQKPSAGSMNIIQNPDDTMKDIPNTTVDGAKHGVVHGKVRIFGYKDEIRKPANRFAPYAVYPDIAHVEDLYLEYYYKKISSSERVWELFLIDENGVLEYCDAKRIQIILPFPSIWSEKEQIYWKWTERYARKHYEWEFAPGEIHGYAEANVNSAWAWVMFYTHEPYRDIKDYCEFGPRIEMYGGEFGVGTTLFIQNSKK